jgi:hypothetical protein
VIYQMLRLCVILRRRGQALAAMDPLKYEVLRDEHRRAVENEQQRRAKEAADLAARQTEQERIKARARREAELEKARGFDGQKAGYDQRQREEAASQKREANRTAYLKVHDPREYARQERDKQIKDQRTADELEIVSRWEQQRTQASKQPQREQPQRENPEREILERSRENGDVAERKEPNKYRREMSEQTREAIDMVLANDALEHTRERERSGR